MGGHVPFALVVVLSGDRGHLIGTSGSGLRSWEQICTQSCWRLGGTEMQRVTRWAPIVVELLERQRCHDWLLALVSSLQCAPKVKMELVDQVMGVHDSNILPMGLAQMRYAHTQVSG